MKGLPFGALVQKPAQARRKLTFIIHYFHKDRHRNVLYNKNHLLHHHREVVVVEEVWLFGIAMGDSFVLVESSSTYRVLLKVVVFVLITQFIEEKVSVVVSLAFFVDKPSSTAVSPVH